MSSSAKRSGPTQDFIQKGKEAFPRHLPDQEFEAPVWDVSSLKKRPFGNNQCVYWTLYGSQKVPLPDSFVAPVKAACTIDFRSVTNLIIRVRAVRMLWEHLRKKIDSPSSFHWTDLTEDDLRGMETEMRENWAKSTTYKTCTAWSRVLDVLSTESVIRPMDIRWQTPRPEDTSRFTLEGREKRKEKHLPSDRAIEAVARVYSDLASKPSDRLLSCLTAILTATGLRVGEVLALPVDPLSKSTRDGETRWHLQYWPEKTGGARRGKDLLHLTERPASLVSEAIEEIRQITSEARRRAQVLEQNRGRAPIEGASQESLLKTKKVKDILDLIGSPTPKVRQTGIPILEREQEGCKRPEYLCRVSDIEEYLLDRQDELWTVNLDGEEKQPLSDSLFVVHVNFFHNTKGTKTLLVDSVGRHHVSDFLNGRWTSCEEEHEEAERHNGKWMRCVMPSVFRQFGLREKDGSEIGMTSHQFRHWLTTQLVDSGVPDGIIVRWQNRSHDGDISAYKHATRTDRLREVKHAIQSGRMEGTVADMYFAMVEDIRDAWLDSYLQQIHVTHMGLCTHDFSSSPCPHHLQCLNGCEDFLFDPEDDAQRKNIERIVEDTREAVQLAEKQEENNEQWMQHQEKILANGLKILHAETQEEPEYAQPFEGQGSNFTPYDDNDFIPMEEAIEQLDEDETSS